MIPKTWRIYKSNSNNKPQKNELDITEFGQ